MQRIVLMLTLLLGVSIARANDLFSLSSDKATYQLSEKAHVTITVLSPPSNVDVEYTYEAEMNGVKSTVVSLGDTHAVAISDQLGATTPFSVKLYLQNIRKAAEYSSTIQFYQKQNLELERKVAKETNAAAKAILIQQKERNIAIIAHAETLKVANRTLLQTRSIDLVVDSLSSTLKPKLLNPTVVITQTNSNSIYELGEQAQFNVSISNVTSDTEVLSKAQIPYHQGKPEISMVKGGTVSSVVTYNTPAFTEGDVGKRKFIANVSYRSKAQAAYYKDLVSKSESERAKLIKKRNETQDDRLKDYYSAKIADIDSVVYGFKNKLDGLLVKITENAELAFRIKDQNIVPTMILEWPAGDLAEAVAGKTGSVKLNYEPDADVTISFDAGDQLHSIAPITITDQNWMEHHEFQINPNDDDYWEGYHYGQVVASASGPDFDGQVEGHGYNITDKTYKYKKISVGTYNACATKGQRLVCWGQTSDYEFGNNANYTIHAPMVVTNLNRVTDVKNGYRHRCALNDGALYCWGRNSSGQAGIGNTSAYVMQPTPVLGMGSGVTDFGMGNHHTCAIANQQLYCWGAGDSYQNGTGTTGNTGFPTWIQTTDAVVKLSMGASSVCFLTDKNDFYCFGSNGSGEIGTTSTASVPWPTLANNFKVNTAAIVSMTSGNSNTRCVSTTANTQCSGANSFRQMGSNLLTANNYYSPQIVTTLGSQWKMLTISPWSHGCGIYPYSDNVMCWGSVGGSFNYNGTGGTVGSATPVNTVGLVPPISELSASHYQTCAVDSVGLKCWGEKYLGDGTTDSSLVPVLIPHTSL